MATNPFNSANYPTVIDLMISIMGNLVAIEEDDRAKAAVEANIRSLCLILGWSLSDLIQQAEQRERSTEALRLGALFCRFCVASRQRTLTAEDIINARNAIADLWLTIQPKEAST